MVSGNKRKVAKFKIPMKGDAPKQEAPMWKCDACGEPIPPSSFSWVILASGQLIHYGKDYEFKCWRAILNG